MAGLETAQQHVDEALRRLEAVLARRLSSAPHAEAGSGAAGTLARDVAALRSECDRLNAALREAEEQNRTMREITETVARRLDGPISEIDRMLEG